MPLPNRSEVEQPTCVRRAALQRRPPDGPAAETLDTPALWFVKVTVGGGRLAPELVRSAFERLSVDRAFVVSVRYGADCAEVRYWDECGDVDEAIRLALSLWGDGEVQQRLPGWSVIGLEVVDRLTARRQRDHGDHPRVFALGEILPFDQN